MSEKIDYSKGIYDARQLGAGRMFILGVQHMFAMFGATVLVPLLTGLSVSTTLLCAGLGTLLFHLITKKKVPAFLGSSFAYLGGFSIVAPMLADADGNLTVANTKMLPYACAAVAFSGLVYLVASLLISTFGIRRIMKFFPPVVTGPIIISIGLILAPSAITNCQANWLLAGLGAAAALLPPARGVNFLVRRGMSLEERYFGPTALFNEREKRRLLADYAGDGDPMFLTEAIWDATEGLDPVTRMQQVDLNLWLAGDILLKADKMSMAHSLELRVPFLDREVWALAAALPAAAKADARTTKIALRRVSLSSSFGMICPRHSVLKLLCIRLRSFVVAYIGYAWWALSRKPQDGSKEELKY